MRGWSEKLSARQALSRQTLKESTKEKRTHRQPCSTWGMRLYGTITHAILRSQYAELCLFWKPDRSPNRQIYWRNFQGPDVLKKWTFARQRNKHISHFRKYDHRWLGDVICEGEVSKLGIGGPGETWTRSQTSTWLSSALSKNMGDGI